MADKKVFTNIINREDRPSASDDVLDIIDPSTGEVYATSPKAADVKVSHLELGGKAPVVVFNDADLLSTVEGIKVGGFFNGGQDCTAATRVLCQSGIYEEFVGESAKSAAETRTGYDADDEDVFYGFINNANQLRHISGLVDRARDHVRVVTGGKPTGDRGYFYEPTVIADLAQGDELIKTEIFGPVITVQNSATKTRPSRSPTTRSMHSSSVWTTDAGTAVRMAARLDFGCWINCHIQLQAEMPHGGFKHSGYGKDLSLYGLEDYTRIKHVMQHHGFEG
jgi:betaine-aldehyde dehydrogenase